MISPARGVKKEEKVSENKDAIVVRGREPRVTRWIKQGDHPAVGPYYRDGHTNDLRGDWGWLATPEGGRAVAPGDWIVEYDQLQEK